MAVWNVLVGQAALVRRGSADFALRAHTRTQREVLRALRALQENTRIQVLKSARIVQMMHTPRQIAILFPVASAMQVTLGTQARVLHAILEHSK